MRGCQSVDGDSSREEIQTPSLIHVYVITSCLFNGKNSMNFFSDLSGIEDELRKLRVSQRERPSHLSGNPQDLSKDLVECVFSVGAYQTAEFPDHLLLKVFLLKQDSQKMLIDFNTIIGLILTTGKYAFFSSTNGIFSRLGYKKILTNSKILK